ncbi:MAG: hypothetical protein VXZ87_03920 [Bacteroidota bacterium]|nr:hypothetical protein [Bacteroidota bacterium]
MDATTVWGIGGAIVGASAVGAAWLWFHRDPELPIVIKDETAEKQQDVILQLTDFDLVKPVCAPKFIEENTDLLCREMFCRMQQRGVDAKTGNECENIANVSNKKAILKACKHAIPEVERECIEFFDRRI